MLKTIVYRSSVGMWASTSLFGWDACKNQHYSKRQPEHNDIPEVPYISKLSYVSYVLIGCVLAPPTFIGYTVARFHTKLLTAYEKKKE